MMFRVRSDASFLPVNLALYLQSSPSLLMVFFVRTDTQLLTTQFCNVFAMILERFDSPCWPLEFTSSGIWLF